MLVARYNECYKPALKSMFDTIKKYFRKEMPEFNSLKAFADKDKYFYRVALWDLLTETEIHIYDPHGPRMFTLDEWPQIVFLKARGQLTVTEFVDHMASQYKFRIPAELDETIIEQLNSLSDSILIAYADHKIDLEAKFENPLSLERNDS